MSGFERNGTPVSKRSLVDRIVEIGAERVLGEYRETSEYLVRGYIDLSFAKFVAVDFRGADLSDTKLIGVSFERCLFDKNTIFCKRNENGNVLQKVWISAVMFEEVDLSGLSFADLDFSNCEFLKCEMDSCSFVNSTLIATNFRESNLRNCVFFSAVMRSQKPNTTDAKNPYGCTSFLRSRVKGSDFSGAIGFERSRVVKEALDGSEFDVSLLVRHETAPLSTTEFNELQRRLDMGVLDFSAPEEERSGIFKLPKAKSSKTTSLAQKLPLGVKPQHSEEVSSVVEPNDVKADPFSSEQDGDVDPEELIESVGGIDFIEELTVNDEDESGELVDGEDEESEELKGEDQKPKEGKNKKRRRRKSKKGGK